MGSPPSSPLPHGEGCDFRISLHITSIIHQREEDHLLFFQHHARVFFTLIYGHILGLLLRLLGLLLGLLLRLLGRFGLFGRLRLGGSCLEGVDCIGDWAAWEACSVTVRAARGRLRALGVLRTT